MPEAVIVSAARSPIGRAMKGSLVSMRPDDLAVQMVRAALDKVPALNPHQIDDLIMGCGLPGGESGFNIARVVAVALGPVVLATGSSTHRSASSCEACSPKRRPEAQSPSAKLQKPSGSQRPSKP